MLHPYYKLAPIKLLWRGPKEQAAEIAAGNIHAKDWQDEARQIVERTVSLSTLHLFLLCLIPMFNIKQMLQYYENRPPAPTVNKSSGNLAAEMLILLDFDKHCKTLLADDAQEGWASELCCYLSTME